MVFESMHTHVHTHTGGGGAEGESLPPKTISRTQNTQSGEYEKLRIT